MATTRGTEYVERWPSGIASRLGLSVEHVALALRAVTGASIPQTAFYRTVDAAAYAHAIAAVGALTPDQAMAVVAELRTIKAQIDAHEHTHCRFCGLPMVRGRCEECV